MKILNIHGYNGFKTNSVYNALTECGYDVISTQLDYDKERPCEILNKLTEMYEKNNCSAVAGASLGGFFAANICAEKNCRAIFVNPCLMPFVVLPELGYNNIEGITEFIRLFKNIADIDKSKVMAIVGDNDEVIKSHDFTKLILDNERYTVVKGGMHSGATLPLKDIFSKYGKDFLSD